MILIYYFKIAFNVLYIVAVAPYDLSVSEEQHTVEAGVNLNVECSASGVPIPDVTWYKDGSYVPHQKRDVGSSTLLLRDISSADFGMYVCKAVSEIKGEYRSIKGYSFIEGMLFLRIMFPVVIEIYMM